MKIESYDLRLDVDFPRAFVRGRVGITVAGAESPLNLDAAMMKIRSVNVDGKPARFNFDKARSKLKVFGVPKRRSLVDIRYDKQVSDAIYGLYKAKYGKEYILATDLEPAEARTVFPCKDEPVYKAVFRVEITTQKGLSAISNMPASRVERAEDGRTRFVFEQTPKMSTYLLFFAVGKLEELKMNSGDIEVIGATRPGQVGNSRFIVDVVAHVLADFQTYFDVPYPLEKLHLVALPEYPAGAMENWGAITARESRLLVNDQSSFVDRASAANTMTHEVAHMWFGDLVTMKWWDDLWLNESFATIMSYKMVDRLHPEWEVWDDFLKDQVSLALNLDALASTHPVRVPTKTVEEAIHNFDVISYNKGASVLRMLESYVGEEAFRRGVSDYLRKFSFANAAGSDLWKSLGKASNLPVSRVARGWLTKPGFPVVGVSKEDGGVTLTQSRFTMGGPARGVWPIPVNLRVDNQEKSLLMSKRTVSLPGAGSSEIIVNAGRRGFYAVNYDQEGWERIAERFLGLDPKDRAGIMTDQFLFLQAGMVDPRLYFRFVSLASEATDSLTIETVTQQFYDLIAVAGEAPPVRTACKRFFPSVLGRVGETPRPGEPPAMKATREAVTTMFARTDPEYANKLAGRFDDFEHLDSNLRTAVAISYAVTKGEEAKGPLLRMVKTSESEVEREKIYAALSAFTDPRLVVDTLDLVVSGEVSRSDTAYALRDAARNPNARGAVCDWMARRYDTLYKIYAGGQSFYLLMWRSIPYCGVGREAEIRRLLSGGRMKAGGSMYSRALELLQVYTRLRERLMATNNS